MKRLIKWLTTPTGRQYDQPPYSQPDDATIQRLMILENQLVLMKISLEVNGPSHDLYFHIAKTQAYITLMRRKA